MAGSQPTRAQVDELMAFIDVPEAQSRTLLRKANNDIERAVNLYFDDPSGSVREPVSTVDGLHHRQEGTEAVQAPANEWEYADNLPSFRIDTQDNAPSGIPATRPPSRADDGRNVIDLTAEHAAATASTSQSLKEQEDMQDADLQRAIAMSKGEMQDQENGVTTENTHFGPANRPHYEQDQWGMIPFSSSREIIEHPPPSKRRRIQGEPAFLRGSSDTGYLGALLTIYHGIPLARKALLMPSMRVHAYGYDPAWWSGTTDENTKSISVEDPDSDSQDRHNLLAEVQCLMAFLDNTDRAYGSVDALHDLRSVKMFEAETPFSRFLEAWKEQAVQQDPDEQLTQIFSSTALKDSGGEDAEQIEKSLVCLEPAVNRFEGQLLVDLLDSTIWNDTADTIDDVWIHHTAEVFTMRMFDPANHPRGLGLATTAVWYPDRYLYECRAVTQQMRREMQSVRRKVNYCVSLQRKCELVYGPDRRPLKVRDVLQAAAKVIPVAAAGSASEMPNGVGDESASPSTHGAGPAEVWSIDVELQSMLERIDRKLEMLEDKRKELLVQMRKIALHLTQPSEDASQPPHRKYLLSGVSTKPHIVYVRRPQTELIDFDDEDDSAEQETNSGWQWWRIAWTKDNTPGGQAVHPPLVGPTTRTQAESENGADQSSNLPDFNPGAQPDELMEHLEVQPESYSIRTVQEAEVIEAAKTENQSVVLVYANENALAFRDGPLSTALKHFVDQDNRVFGRELREEMDVFRGRAAAEVSEEESQLPLISPDTDTTIMDDVPLLMGQADQGSSAGWMREMTPMSMSTSMSSPPRDADGQPSPKRAKAELGSGSGSGSDVPPPPQSQQHGPFGHELPSYEDSMTTTTAGSQEMQEVKANRIGLHSERMLERYGGGGNVSDTAAVPAEEKSAQHSGTGLHLEHDMTLPR